MIPAKERQIPVETLARIVIPFGVRNGFMGMLVGYFDDSGTHGSSDVVLWSGLFGTEAQWGALSKAWQSKLLDPSPGKPPLSKFHMVDCEGHHGEFTYWNRTESDFLIQELGDIIASSGVFSLAKAVARKEWDRLVQGNWRKAWGDAEGYCVRTCYSEATRLARSLNCQSMSLLFDDRPGQNEIVQKVFDIYRIAATQDNRSVSLDSISFVRASRFYPLQAADLIAWEQYQCALDWIRDGIGAPKRRLFRRLYDTKKFRLTLMREDGIQKLLSSAAGNAEVVSLVARALSEIDFSKN